MAHTFIVLSTIYADQLVVSPDAGALSLSNTIKSTSTYLTTIHFSSFFFLFVSWNRHRSESTIFLHSRLRPPFVYYHQHD